MGLVVVERIVYDHGGTIRMGSSLAQGTKFQVFFPCAIERAAEIPNSISAEGMERARSRKGTILVVDDEELLRGAVSKSLRRLGFTVVVTSAYSKETVDFPGRRVQHFIRKPFRVAELIRLLTDSARI